WNMLSRGQTLPNAATLDIIATENNPRPLRGLMVDSADYWVKSNDEPLTITFPLKSI
ncbi:hypothetical protein J3R82DRAFT_5024, partial [Butyriboletus roseoflavus]